jgi:hypothetical protein
MFLITWIIPHAALSAPSVEDLMLIREVVISTVVHNSTAQHKDVNTTATQECQSARSTITQHAIAYLGQQYKLISYICRISQRDDSSALLYKLSATLQ